MIARLFVLLCVVAWPIAKWPLSEFSGSPGSKRPPEFRTQAIEVQVTLSAEDTQHRIISNLSRQDFTVLEDGKPVPDIAAFHTSFDLPLRLALLLDGSTSMQKGFAGGERAAQDFVSRVVRPSTDSLVLVEFSNQAMFSDAPSGRPDLIFAGLRPPQAGALTALYDALYETSLKMLLTRNENEPEKSVIVLFSDGEDDLSMHNLQQAIEIADRADISIYAITAHTTRKTHPGDAVLRQLADSTGGRAFILRTYEDSDHALAAVEQELRTQYTVSFRPHTATGCGYHRLAVVPIDHQLHIRARDRYYRCPPGAGPAGP